MLLVLLMTGVALWLLGKMWSVVWPLVVALLLTTLTWPLTRFLRRHGWPPPWPPRWSPCCSLLIAAGIVVLIAVPVASQSGELANGVVDGIQQLREWAAGPPLNIGDDQVTSAFDAAVTRIQDSVGSIVTATVTGVGTVVNGVVTTVLAIFLMFFFLKDGPRFLPWLTRQLPGRLAVDVPIVAARGWDTLGAFVRSQAFVGLLDAVFIGLGLWIVGVPLVLPLAVLTFVSAFVPIVGALFAGFVAVLIALVSNGPTDALIVLAIIIAGAAARRATCSSRCVQSRGLGPARCGGPAGGDPGRQPGRHRGQPAGGAGCRAGRGAVELRARAAQRPAGGAGGRGAGARPIGGRRGAGLTARPGRSGAISPSAAPGRPGSRCRCRRRPGRRRCRPGMP